MSEKYELEEIREFRGEYYLHAYVSILTGLSYDEISPHIERRMTGSKFRRAFNKLGFNTNHRFIAFDPETQYPALIKCHLRGETKHWYPFVYYDNKVYAPDHGGVYDSLDSFLINNKDFRITSMLQVWI